MISALDGHDFGWIREPNPNWESQKEIPEGKSLTALACLLYYDGRVSDVMQFLGNNYTASYRDTQGSVQRMRGLVDNELLERYEDVMTKGAPIIQRDVDKGELSLSLATGEPSLHHAKTEPSPSDDE
jgi:hypothetical protein